SYWRCCCTPVRSMRKAIHGAPSSTAIMAGGKTGFSPWQKNLAPVGGAGGDLSPNPRFPPHPPNISPRPSSHPRAAGPPPPGGGPAGAGARQKDDHPGLGGDQKRKVGTPPRPPKRPDRGQGEEAARDHGGGRTAPHAPPPQREPAIRQERRNHGDHESANRRVG